jgi:hypothetical protein
MEYQQYYDLSGEFINNYALIYMITNVYRAETIIRIWFLIILTGVITVKSGLSMKWRNPIIWGWAKNS